MGITQTYGRFRYSDFLIFFFSVFKSLRKLTTLNPREVAEQLLEKALFPQSHRRLLRKLRECTNFLWRFPRTVGGRTGATNWWKTSQNDRKQISNFASGWVVGYFGPNWSKIWESFLPYMGIICFHNILRFGYEAPLRVGYNKVTWGVNAHTEEKLYW